MKIVEPRPLGEIPHKKKRNATHKHRHQEQNLKNKPINTQTETRACPLYDQIKVNVAHLLRYSCPCISVSLEAVLPKANTSSGISSRRPGPGSNSSRGSASARQTNFTPRSYITSTSVMSLLTCWTGWSQSRSRGWQRTLGSISYLGFRVMGGIFRELEQWFYSNQIPRGGEWVGHCPKYSTPLGLRVQ